jgi:UDP-N-acetylglucosamine 1-carboxyvinyltransferase
MQESFIEVRQSFNLSGEIYVDGAKNALLPIIPAALLYPGICIINNVTNFDDIHSFIDLLRAYNVFVEFDAKQKKLTIDSHDMKNNKVDYSLFSKLRASTLIAGALLARFKEAWIGYPGGDKIGQRPIDFHLYAFQKMGAVIKYENNYIYICVPSWEPATIIFDYPSVGATQNVLLAAAGSDCTTIIKNAAQEPEITDMICALSSMGMNIESSFGGTIKINRGKKRYPLNYAVMEDRLEAATLLMMAAITRGSITIPNAPVYAMETCIKKLEDMGNKITFLDNKKGISLIAHERLSSLKIKTMPYPGFATDLQSPIMALLSVSNGKSSIHETVFESRMHHASELNKMGALITVSNDYAYIEGVASLKGTVVYANDIRAGAALVLAGLFAEGTTHIFGVHHLLRGYYALDKKVQSLGGYMEIISYPEAKKEKVSDESKKEINNKLLNLN